MKTAVKRAAQRSRAAAASPPAPQPTSQVLPASQVTRPALMLAQVRSGPKTNRSQVHPGVAPLNAVASRNTSFQPLPRPLGSPPYHYDLAAKFPAIGANITNRMVFHIVGDSGGVKDGEYQDMVAQHMITEVVDGGRDKPQFCYHVGDVVYFTGMHDDYYAQFYEPYAHYEPPIFSIPGNHDGEVDNPDAQTSLDGWVDYFMQAHPDVDPISKDAPRVQLDLPNVFWTLVTPLATILGMYTNVPEHGSVDSNQQQWVTHEFATAPSDRALILALHHPIYSFDKFHSGSSKMADVLENAIRDTGRVPNLVLTGHVHNYQRIEQTIAPDGPTPFIVTGNGGYHNLHKLHSGAGDSADDTGAVLKYGTDTTWGFVTLTIDKNTISGVTTEIHKDGTAGQGDSFSYPAGPITLRNPRAVPNL